MKLSTNWEASIADGVFGGGWIIFGTRKTREERNSRGGEVENYQAGLDMFFYISVKWNTWLAYKQLICYQSLDLILCMQCFLDGVSENSCYFFNINSCMKLPNRFSKRRASSTHSLTKSLFNAITRKIACKTISNP